MALAQLHPNVGNLGDLQRLQKEALLMMVKDLCKPVASAHVEEASSHGAPQSPSAQQPSAPQVCEDNPKIPHRMF
jgi:hypothetical protein